MSDELIIVAEDEYGFSYDVCGSLCNTLPDAIRAYVEAVVYSYQIPDTDDDPETMVNALIEREGEDALLVKTLSPRNHAVRIDRDELIEATRAFIQEQTA